MGPFHRRSFVAAALCIGLAVSAAAGQQETTAKPPAGGPPVAQPPAPGPAPASRTVTPPPPPPAKPETPSLWCRIFGCAPQRPGEVDFTRPAGVAQSDLTDQRELAVAVLPLDASKVREAAATLLGTDQDLGAGFSGLIAAELARSSQYRVIERARIESVMKEQSLGNSFRIAPPSQALRATNSDALVFGEVESFSIESAASERRRFGLGGLFGSGQVKAANAPARVVVTINLRMMSANGEIVAAARGRGEVPSTVDRNAALEQAVAAAIQDASRQLNTAAPRVAAARDADRKGTQVPNLDINAARPASAGQD
jgi:curli biogenesis system outer membrane secretion channel CsgG